MKLPLYGISLGQMTKYILAGLITLVLGLSVSTGILLQKNQRLAEENGRWKSGNKQLAAAVVANHDAFKTTKELLLDCTGKREASAAEAAASDRRVNELEELIRLRNSKEANEINEEMAATAGCDVLPPNTSRLLIDAAARANRD